MLYLYADYVSKRSDRIHLDEHATTMLLTGALFRRRVRLT